MKKRIAAVVSAVLAVGFVALASPASASNAYYNRNTQCQANKYNSYNYQYNSAGYWCYD